MLLHQIKFVYSYAASACALGKRYQFTRNRKYHCQYVCNSRTPSLKKRTIIIHELAYFMRVSRCLGGEVSQLFVPVIPSVCALGLKIL